MLHEGAALLLLVHLVCRQGVYHPVKPLTDLVKTGAIDSLGGPTLSHQVLQLRWQLLAPPVNAVQRVWGLGFRMQGGTLQAMSEEM